jgi:hypothetical protein
MFEHMIAVEMKMNTKHTYRDDEGINTFMKPIQLRPTLIDRVLPALGDAMISVGLKLKYRPHPSLATEQAQAPNYLIML